MMYASSSMFVMGFQVKNSGIRSISSHVRPNLSQLQKPLFMADDKDPVFIASNKKEMVYDEKTGRFFETGFGEGDCIPDEEFCMVDKQSGEQIRLTVEEKERIFLDALQVRYIPFSSMKSMDVVMISLTRRSLYFFSFFFLMCLMFHYLFIVVLY